MKKFGKVILKLTATLLALAAIGAIGYFGYRYYEEQQFLHNRPQVTIAKDGTNTNAAWQTKAQYNQALRQKYSFINKLSNYVPPRTWVGKDVIVPGLVQTKSYDFKTKKIRLRMQ